MADQSVSQEKTPRIEPPPPSYWSCKNRLNILRRYQDIVRHKEGWAHDIEHACPLEELIPEAKSATDRFILFDREINRLTPLVHWALNEVGVLTGIVSIRREPSLGEHGVIEREVTEKHDIILDYLDLGHQQRTYELLMRSLERGIGIYQSRMKIAYRELFNPIVWFAYLIRIPIAVMEHAGISPTERLVAGFYSVVIRILMFLVLLFTAIKLGISIPWADLANLISKIKI